MATKYAKSLVNYTGSKQKLLDQILPYFPKHVDRFVDLFEGSGVVVENYDGADQYVANDLNSPLVKLQKYITDVDLEDFKGQVKDVIKKYHLTDTVKHSYKYYGVNSSKGLTNVNKANYLQLRSDYNHHKFMVNPNVMFYVLIVYCFNNQIRFSKSGDFNISTGKRDWNKSMRKKLEQFSKKCNGKKLVFLNKDFADVDIKPNDFVYIDPPYLLADATYNKFWSKYDEKRLYRFCNQLTDHNIKFAFSNVMLHQGNLNKPLQDWANNNHYYVNPLKHNYTNSSYHRRRLPSQEVLITNYK